MVDDSGDLSRVLMELDENGVAKAYYVYGLGLIGREDNSGQYQSYHSDIRGSTTLLSDEQSRITDRYEYGPYGKVEHHEGTKHQPYQYNGRDGVMTDPNGLYYMRARYYHPDLGRFLNRDIIKGDLADGQTLNRYVYVNGDPIRYIDPLGLDKEIGLLAEGVGEAGSTIKPTYYHSANPDVVDLMKQNGFRIDLPTPQQAFHNNRFGNGVYLGDSPATVLAERPGGIVLKIEADIGKNLNVVDRGIIDYNMGQSIARGARKHGYDSISFISQAATKEGFSGINTMVLNPTRVVIK